MYRNPLFCFSTDGVVRWGTCAKETERGSTGAPLRLSGDLDVWRDCFPADNDLEAEPFAGVYLFVRPWDTRAAATAGSTASLSGAEV